MAVDAPIRDLFEEVLRQAAIAVISTRARADGEYVAWPGPQIVEHRFEATRHYPPANLLRIHGSGPGGRAVEPRRQCGAHPVITDGGSYRARILKGLVAEIPKALIGQQFAYKAQHHRGASRTDIRAQSGVKFCDHDHLGLSERYRVSSISRHVVQEIVAQRHAYLLSHYSEQENTFPEFVLAPQTSKTWSAATPTHPVFLFDVKDQDAQKSRKRSGRIGRAQHPFGWIGREVRFGAPLMSLTTSFRSSRETRVSPASMRNCASRLTLSRASDRRNCKFALAERPEPRYADKIAASGGDPLTSGVWPLCSRNLWETGRSHA